MSIRLQVIMNPQEYSLIKRVSAGEGKTVSQFVRDLIHSKIKKKPKYDEDPISKMEKLNLPTGSITKILKEIEEGRQ